MPCRARRGALRGAAEEARVASSWGWSPVVPLCREERVDVLLRLVEGALRADLTGHRAAGLQCEDLLDGVGLREPGAVHLPGLHRLVALLDGVVYGAEPVGGRVGQRGAAGGERAQVGAA